MQADRGLARLTGVALPAQPPRQHRQAIPRSSAIPRRVLTLVSASRTASRRNSGVGLFPFPIEHLLLPQLVLSTFSGQVQIDVRPWPYRRQHRQYFRPHAGRRASGQPDRHQLRAARSCPVQSVRRQGALIDGDPPDEGNAAAQGVLRHSFDRGSRVAGRDVEAACNANEELEDTARLAMMTRGMSLRGLSERDVQRLVKAFDVEWDALDCLPIRGFPGRAFAA